MRWKTKYTAKKTKVGDQIYDSHFEAKVAQELTLRQVAGEITHYDTQHKIDLIVNGYVVGVYNIDFVAYRKDGVMEFIEAKGYAGDTPVWRLKWSILEAMMKGRTDVELKVDWQNGANHRMRKIKKC